tara:strand:+ start:1630 stop:1824 length:195 start_codon:yes stop_codon:yes gene_type:complete
MAKLTCDAGNCDKDTGYYEGTANSKRIRSIRPGATDLPTDKQGELVFCSSCWTALGFKDEFGRG